MEAFQQTKHALENFNKLNYTPDNPHTKLIRKIYALNHDVDIVIQEITKDIRPISFFICKTPCHTRKICHLLQRFSLQSNIFHHLLKRLHCLYITTTHIHWQIYTQRIHNCISQFTLEIREVPRKWNSITNTLSRPIFASVTSLNYDRIAQDRITNTFWHCYNLVRCILETPKPLHISQPKGIDFPAVIWTFAHQQAFNSEINNWTFLPDHAWQPISETGHNNACDDKNIKSASIQNIQLTLCTFSVPDASFLNVHIIIIGPLPLYTELYFNHSWSIHPLTNCHSYEGYLYWNNIYNYIDELDRYIWRTFRHNHGQMYPNLISFGNFINCLKTNVTKPLLTTHKQMCW